MSVLREYYKPLIYLVKRYGSLYATAKHLGVSHQLIRHWNRNRAIPDKWKKLMHDKYRVPYKCFFQQIDAQVVVKKK